ncbi:MAG: hypothetical protein KGO96_10520 [Elusimicrobia bacterium]|nr:hypothetical protein [Elusimicrobiota bacterium]
MSLAWLLYIALHPVTFFLLGVVLVLCAVRLHSNGGIRRAVVALAALGLMAFGPAGLPLPIAFTNANLTSYDAYSGAWPVLRLGYATPGDSPAVWFWPSASACPLNAGAGDNGTQVQSGNSGCWHAYPGTLTFEQFGATQTATDSRAAINNAINAACQLGVPLKPLAPSYNIATLTSGQNYALFDNCQTGNGVRIHLTDDPIHVWLNGSESPKAPLILKWTGGNQTAPFYMAYIGAVPGSGIRVEHDDWASVMFDCQGSTGCGGALVKSVEKGNFNLSTWEPRAEPYTTASTSIAITAAGVSKGYGGTGYGTSATGTLTGTFSFCSPEPVINVTTNSGGAVTTVNSVTTAGTCTQFPVQPQASWTAGGGLSAGSGVQLDLVSNTLNMATTAGIQPGMLISEIDAITTTSSAPNPGDTTLSVTSTSGFQVGDVLQYGPMPANTKITSITSGMLHLSAPVGQAGGHNGDTVQATAIPPGCQVLKVVNGTTLQLTCNLQASLGAVTVAVGGEGVRVDVTQSLSGDINDTQDSTWRLTVRNTAVLSTSAPQNPGIYLGAMNVTGQGSLGVNHYGNFSGNKIPWLECSYIFTSYASNWAWTPCAVFGDGDHNQYGDLVGTGVNGIVGVGQIYGQNLIGGPPRYFKTQWVANYAEEGAELGFARVELNLGIALAGVLSSNPAGAYQSSTYTNPSAGGAFAGLGNHGIMWRLDAPTAQWLLSDAVLAINGVSYVGDSQFSSYSNNGLSNSPGETNASSACKFLGLAAQTHGPQLSARTTGNITVEFAGYMENTGASAGGATIYAGTGTPPAAGTGATGTAIGVLPIAPGNAAWTIPAAEYGPSVSAQVYPQSPVWADICVTTPTNADTITFVNPQALMRENN